MSKQEEKLLASLIPMSLCQCLGVQAELSNSWGSGKLGGPCPRAPVLLLTPCPLSPSMNASNKFANDGSFLQQFLKLQEAKGSSGEGRD